jgi:Icc-related predicted phosphoesterase
MNILAAADLHGEGRFYISLLEAAKPLDAQAIVLAGDLLGYAPGFDKAEDAQSADARSVLSLLESSPVTVFYIMGNDDLVELTPGAGHVRSIHGIRIELGGYDFLGYQYSLPFMAGVFEKTEEEIRRDLAALVAFADDRTVFVTHSPAFGHLDRTRLGTHAGSSSILDFVERTGVRAHIHGHIHSGFGRDGRHFNVAALPPGRAMLIDVDRMTHRALDLTAR